MGIEELLGRITDLIKDLWAIIGDVVKKFIDKIVNGSNDTTTTGV